MDVNESALVVLRIVGSEMMIDLTGGGKPRESIEAPSELLLDIYDDKSENLKG